MGVGPWTQGPDVLLAQGLTTRTVSWLRKSGSDPSVAWADMVNSGWGSYPPPIVQGEAALQVFLSPTSQQTWLIAAMAGADLVTRHQVGVRQAQVTSSPTPGIPPDVIPPDATVEYRGAGVYTGAFHVTAAWAFASSGTTSPPVTVRFTDAFPTLAAPDPVWFPSAGTLATWAEVGTSSGAGGSASWESTGGLVSVAAAFTPQVTGETPTPGSGVISATADVTTITITRLYTPSEYRLHTPGGAWRLRQRQSLAGTDSWPLRQRQNGTHSGSWPLRQRQSGV